MVVVVIIVVVVVVTKETAAATTVFLIKIEINQGSRSRFFKQALLLSFRFFMVLLVSDKLGVINPPK